MAKKRASGEGSVGKHASGLWWARLRLPNGKRKAVYGHTQQEVIQRLNDLKSASKEQLPIDRDRVTVRQQSEDWLNAIRSTVAAKTFVSYESLMRLHVLPVLGGRRLRELGPKDVQAAYSLLLDKGMTAATLDNTHRALHACLEKAVQWGLLHKNPSDHVDRPRLRRPPKPMLSEHEVQRLLEAARGDRLEALFALALSTGARSGELLALTWKDIDLESGVVSVSRSLKKVNGGYEFGDTKTRGSIREIDIGPRTIQHLKEHRARQDEEILSVGEVWNSSLNLVFANRVGGPLDQRNVLQRSFRPIVKEAGLPETLRFHDLRHIFASLALSKGMDVVRVSAMLGHSSPSTTLDVYSHALPGHGKPVAAAMDAVIAG